MNKDGKIVFSTTFDYAYTPLDLMIYKMDNSYYVLKDMVPKLRKYGEAIVKEFGMKERFFHIEFFREGDDYITIEYNNRPAGGFTIDVYNFAHSLDLYRGYAAIVAGEEFPASEFEPQYCLATSRRANAHYVYSEENLLAKYSQQFKVKKSCQRLLRNFKEITFICWQLRVDKKWIRWLLISDNVKNKNYRIKEIHSLNPFVLSGKK